MLAFGNGAPDVFSAISAVHNMKDGDVVFGALLGKWDIPPSLGLAKSTPSKACAVTSKCAPTMTHILDYGDLAA